MKELKASKWGIRVDKSKATQTFVLRGTVFPRESSLNYEPSIGYKQKKSPENANKYYANILIDNVVTDFKDYPMSKAMEFLTDVFYKTLDNEVNANVAQTYIYVKSDGRCPKEESLNRLKEWETYKVYNNIKNVKLNILLYQLKQKEVDDFNDILIKNGVKTISSSNIEMWLNYWFKIFKRKSDIFIKNSERILEEIEKDCGIFEKYVSNTYDTSKVIDYSPYISNFEDFKNKKNNE